MNNDAPSRPTRETSRLTIWDWSRRWAYWSPVFSLSTPHFFKCRHNRTIANQIPAAMLLAGDDLRSDRG